jgi:hypothetical protein
MRRVKLLRDWLLLLTLACAAATPLLAETAPAAPQPLARSSLLTLEGANTPAGLLLRVRPNSGTTPLTVSEFSVLLDGKSIPAVARTDGTWLVSLPAPAAGGQLDVTVTHDGIRELLSAKVPAHPGAAAAPAAVTGATGVHKQIVWWILNVLIVLVAAIAISRRTS